MHTNTIQNQWQRKIRKKFISASFPSHLSPFFLSLLTTFNIKFPHPQTLKLHRRHNESEKQHLKHFLQEFILSVCREKYHQLDISFTIIFTLVLNLTFNVHTEKATYPNVVHSPTPNQSESLPHSVASPHISPWHQQKQEKEAEKKVRLCSFLFFLAIFSLLQCKKQNKYRRRGFTPCFRFACCVMLQREIRENICKTRKFTFFSFLLVVNAKFSSFLQAI